MKLHRRRQASYSLHSVHDDVMQFIIVNIVALSTERGGDEALKYKIEQGNEREGELWVQNHLRKRFQLPIEISILLLLQLLFISSRLFLSIDRTCLP